MKDNKDKLFRLLRLAGYEIEYSYPFPGLIYVGKIAGDIRMSCVLSAPSLYDMLNEYGVGFARFQIEGSMQRERVKIPPPKPNERECWEMKF